MYLGNSSILGQLLSIDVNGFLAGTTVSDPQCGSPLAEPRALLPVRFAVGFQAVKALGAGLTLTTTKGC